jgi:hypothetical protein
MRVISPPGTVSNLVGGVKAELALPDDDRLVPSKPPNDTDLDGQSRSLALSVP